MPEKNKWSTMFFLRKDDTLELSVQMLNDSAIEEAFRLCNLTKIQSQESLHHQFLVEPQQTLKIVGDKLRDVCKWSGKT